MPDQLEFRVSEGLIKPIIEAKIQAAVIEAMGGHEKMVTGMLNAYMSQKVDIEGRPGRGYSGDKPRIDHLMTQMIEGALKTALASYLQTKQDVIQKEFERYFNSKKGSSEIIKAMQEGICAALTEKWRTTITFKLKE